jgi:hypothetical protein
MPLRRRLVGDTAFRGHGIELTKPEPRQVGFHGLLHDATIWPVLRWTGPSGKHRQDTFADLGQAHPKNGFGRGRGWGTRPRLFREPHNPSQSAVTGRRLQTLLQGSLQQAWMMIGLRDFFLRAPKNAKQSPWPVVL